VAWRVRDWLGNSGMGRRSWLGLERCVRRKVLVWRRMRNFVEVEKYTGMVEAD
jgi:hypothetical protein